MLAGSFSILGDSAMIEELRSALLEEENAKNLVITEPSPQGEIAAAPTDRVRQIEAAEMLFAFAIHVPASMTAHLLYDWTKNWLKSRAGDTRVTEHPPSSDDKQTPAPQAGSHAGSSPSE
jgi:hypothetical protein